MKKKQIDRLSKAEAKELLKEIRGTIGSVRPLIYQLWKGKADLAFECTNFGEFAERKLGKTIGKSSVYRQLNAAKVELNIGSESQIGDLPESVLRPITDLTQKKQRKVWKEVLKQQPTDTDKPPSAKEVRKVREKMFKSSSADKPKEKAKDWIQKSIGRYVKTITKALPRKAVRTLIKQLEDFLESE